MVWGFANGQIPRDTPGLSLSPSSVHLQSTSAPSTPLPMKDSGLRAKWKRPKTVETVTVWLDVRDQVVEIPLAVPESSLQDLLKLVENPRCLTFSDKLYWTGSTLIWLCVYMKLGRESLVAMKGPGVLGNGFTMARRKRKRAYITTDQNGSDQRTECLCPKLQLVTEN